MQIAAVLADCFELAHAEHLAEFAECALVVIGSSLQAFACGFPDSWLLTSARKESRLVDSWRAPRRQLVTCAPMKYRILPRLSYNGAIMRFMILEVLPLA